jgi:predicted translin family RNA/ssDNA-binding protein
MKYLRKIKKELLNYAEKRREIINKSGDALHLAKRAIFALHRENLKEADQKLKDCEEIFKLLEKKYKNDNHFKEEGSYKAALEEYVEAKIFQQFLLNKKLTEIKEVFVPAEIYVAGLCDVPGELYRYAIKMATKKDLEKVEIAAKLANEISGELTEFNLTSYLRNKFDQAKTAVKKIEYIIYELSIRK